MDMVVDLVMKKSGDLKKFSGGGELIDKGSHLIDLSRFFLGDLRIISSKLKNFFWKMNLEDNYFLNLRINMVLMHFYIHHALSGK